MEHVPKVRCLWCEEFTCEEEYERIFPEGLQRELPGMLRELEQVCSARPKIGCGADQSDVICEEVKQEVVRKNRIMTIW